MQEQEPTLLKNYVITRCCNGRCYYDPKFKQALIRHAASSGMAISELASQHGIAAGLLRHWVKQDRRENSSPGPRSKASAFVPVAVTAMLVTSPSVHGKAAQRHCNRPQANRPTGVVAQIMGHKPRPSATALQGTSA